MASGEYEIRAGLYDESNRRYLSEPEQREWLSNYEDDRELRQHIWGQVRTRQVEDFDDAPITMVIVDLTRNDFE